MQEVDAIGNWQMKMQVKELDISPAGETELYYIGKRLRKKLTGLLRSHFDPREVEIRCTDTERSIRSAQSFLRGLYEHTGGISFKMQTSKLRQTKLC